MHGERHGQAAQDQDARVRGSKPYVQKMASRHKSRQVQISIDRIAAEEAAEEKNLRRQEHPHSQAGSVVLLLGIVELFGWSRGMIRRQVDGLPLHSYERAFTALASSLPLL